MNTKYLIPLCFIMLHSAFCPSLNAQGTAFTYQGRLNAGANPATGVYDLRFALYDATTSGIQLGVAITNTPTSVSNGLFTVTLDFGNQFNGANRWLEIGVRTNGGGAFTTLNPRQPLSPTPYSVYAGNAGSAATVTSSFTGDVSGPQGATVVGSVGGYVAAAVASGASAANAATSSAMPGTIVKRDGAGNFSANTISASFVGNGAGLTNLNINTLNGFTSGSFWNIGGNAGTLAGTNFLGTTDFQPLELKVNGQRAFRLEPNASNAPNVIAGASVNFVAPGVIGATISGGGASTYYSSSFTNSIADDYGTIGGGSDNQIQAGANISTISGGSDNQIQSGAYGSTIGGGAQNQILPGDYYTTIGGGGQNQVQYGSGYSTIGGGYHNQIQVNDFDSTIGGGSFNQIQTNNNESTVGGGTQNQIFSFSANSTIAGGGLNQIQNNASASTIGGGINNLIQTNAYDSTIGGGELNKIQLIAAFSTIGGGYRNQIQDYSSGSTIGGGYQNQIQTYAYGSTIAGGSDNFIEVYANGSTIGGGTGNKILTNSQSATIGGGYNNLILSNASYATIPGGLINAATNYAFAAGYRAKAVTTGSFVWADFEEADFVSTASNQFLIRALGGVGIGKTNPTTALDVNGTVKATAFSGGGAALTGLNAGSLSSGTVPLGLLPAVVVTNNQTGLTLNGNFSGSGAGLTGLNANSLTSGTVPSGVFSGTYSGALTFNNSANSFTGNGAGLTALNAGNLASGIVPLALLPTSVVTNNEAGLTLAGSFSGNGAGLTNLNAANLASGTLADARLSANVALLTGTQTFSGAKSFSAEAAANGGVRINNTNLWFKGDGNHGLGWYGSGRPFATNSTIDGPVLFGFTGGALGTEQFGTEHLAVQWTASTVTVNGTFNNNSDRDAKQHFTPVSPAEILAKVSELPLTEWSYKTDADTRHIGPMAQDFHAAFNVGTDERHIAPIDEGGVALAAIQGLNAKLKNELDSVHAENQQLKARLDALEKLIAKR